MRTIVDVLRRSGLSVSWDQDLLPGSDWDQHLADEIRTADYFIWVMSPASLTAQHVVAEFGSAREAGARIRIVHLGGVDPRDTLLPVGATNWVKLGELAPLVADMIRGTAHRQNAWRRAIVAWLAVPVGGGLVWLSFDSFGPMDPATPPIVDESSRSPDPAGVQHGELLGSGVDFSELAELPVFVSPSGPERSVGIDSSRGSLFILTGAHASIRDIDISDGWSVTAEVRFAPQAYSNAMGIEFGSENERVFLVYGPKGGSKIFFGLRRPEEARTPAEKFVRQPWGKYSGLVRIARHGTEFVAYHAQDRTWKQRHGRIWTEIGRFTAAGLQRGTLKIYAMQNDSTEGRADILRIQVES